MSNCKRGTALAVGLAMLGCETAPPAAESVTASASTDSGGVREAGGEGDAPSAGSVDSDSDGLCDYTESELGTSPDSLDTDADGFPDLIEAEYGFGPLDSGSPALHQVLFLQEAKGASAQMLVSIWVEGQGMSHTGTFRSSEAMAWQQLSAADLYLRTVALFAEPPDQAFGIDPGAARFGAVHARTRLTFELVFAFGDNAAAGCIRGCPFLFGVKRPDDEVLGWRRLMVVTMPQGAEPIATLWCLPEQCR